ncbi:alpha-ketoglutarate-dependent dioxygenase AlkB [Caldimonas tepidiphila]|uniref:alpha-ketoglutarate-dependent dioxygenase AlkB n=1 Tax=Caldimonas tepidiphila TaxID=2315841 RepID=UPI000E5A92EE|nr:alpha-ketoglutarate-dependent dioxygenase AlkB [Caldimonas tepidiphila]
MNPTGPNGQLELFGAEAAPLPPGFAYRRDFIDEAEEAALLAAIAALGLREARYKEWTARRRVASFGSEFDFDTNRLQAGAALPEAFRPLRAKAAAWLGVAPEAFTNMLVAEYRPGTPLGWHRDVPDFEAIVGVSLAGACEMRFRRYPPVPSRRKGALLKLELEPRSAYILCGEARWDWQHAVAPTPGLRCSVTFRTPAARR